MIVLQIKPQGEKKHTFVTACDLSGSRKSIEWANR